MGAGWTSLILVCVTLLVGVGGVTLSLWALLWDRARGRRRCPSCWHDLAGVPGLRCPECGKEARSERRLFRTRRRWRWVVVGIGLTAIVAPTVHAYKRLGNEGMDA